MIVNSHGMEIHVSVEGTGEPIVFAHGAMYDGTMWAPQIEHFRSRYRCLAPDAPGHGRSGKPDAPVTYKLMSDVLADVVTQLDASPAHFVGLSMGTGIMGQLACDHPEMVRSLTFIGAVVYGGDLPLVTEEYIESIEQGSALMISEHIEQAMAPETLQQNPTLLDDFWEVFARADLQVYGSVLRDLMKLDLRTCLRDINVPSIVLWGEHDLTGTPREANQTLIDAIPGARLVTVPAAGHLTNLENPKFVNEQIAALIELADLAVGHR
jgi:pimeloyl-ACP methyl ester carboxylesterase